MLDSGTLHVRYNLVGFIHLSTAKPRSRKQNIWALTYKIDFLLVISSHHLLITIDV